MIFVRRLDGHRQRNFFSVFVRRKPYIYITLLHNLFRPAIGHFITSCYIEIQHYDKHT